MHNYIMPMPTSVTDILQPTGESNGIQNTAPYPFNFRRTELTSVISGSNPNLAFGPFVRAPLLTFGYPGGSCLPITQSMLGTSTSEDIRRTPEYHQLLQLAADTHSHESVLYKASQMLENVGGHNQHQLQHQHLDLLQHNFATLDIKPTTSRMAEPDAVNFFRSHEINNIDHEAAERLRIAYDHSRIERLLHAERNGLSPALLSAIEQAAEETRCHQLSNMVVDNRRIHIPAAATSAACASVSVVGQTHGAPLPQLDSLVSSIGMPNSPCSTIEMLNSAKDGEARTLLGHPNSRNISPADGSTGSLEITHEHYEDFDDQGNHSHDDGSAYSGSSSYHLSHGGTGTSQNSSSAAGGAPGRVSHTCDSCGKTFQNNSALLKHKLIHSDERKYVCTICSKGFKRLDHLNGHLNVHKSVKPFQCVIDGCDKSYCDARSLRRHLEHSHNMQNPVVQSSRGLIHVRCSTGTYVRPMNPSGGGITGAASLVSRPNSDSSMRSRLNGSSDEPRRHIQSNSSAGSNSAASQDTGPRSIASSVITTIESVKRVGSQEFPKQQLQPQTDTPQQQVHCGQCGRVFKNVPALNGHMRLHSHGKKDKPTDTSSCSASRYPSPQGAGAASVLLDSETMSPMDIGGRVSDLQPGQTSLVNSICVGNDHDASQQLSMHNDQCGECMHIPPLGTGMVNSEMKSELQNASSEIKDYAFKDCKPLYCMTNMNEQPYHQADESYTPGSVHHSHHMSAPEALTIIDPQTISNSCSEDHDPMIHSAPASFTYFAENSYDHYTPTNRYPKQMFPAHVDNNHENSMDSSTQDALPQSNALYAEQGTFSHQLVERSQTRPPDEQQHSMVVASVYHQGLVPNAYDNMRDFSHYACHKNEQVCHSQLHGQVVNGGGGNVEQQMTPESMQQVHFQQQQQPQHPAQVANHLSEFQQPILQTSAEPVLMNDVNSNSNLVLEQQQRGGVMHSMNLHDHQHRQVVTMQHSAPPDMSLDTPQHTLQMPMQMDPMQHYVPSPAMGLMQAINTAQQQYESVNSQGLYPLLEDTSLQHTSFSGGPHDLSQDEDYIRKEMASFNLPELGVGWDLNSCYNPNDYSLLSVDPRCGMDHDGDRLDMRQRHFTAPGAISSTKAPEMAPKRPSFKGIHPHGSNMKAKRFRSSEPEESSEMDVTHHHHQGSKHHQQHRHHHVFERNFFNLPVSPARFKRRHRSRPTPLMIPPLCSQYRFCSQLRSPRLWEPESGAKTLPPYTPPPILSPMRLGPGLFWKLCRQNSGGPKSAPISPKFGSRFWGLDEPPAGSCAVAEKVSPQETDLINDRPETAPFPHINRGPAYQAVIPELIEERNVKSIITKEYLLWHPNTLNGISEDDLESYLEFSCSSGVVGGCRNQEYALHLLQICKNVEDAVLALTDPSIRPASDCSLLSYSYVDDVCWTPEEICKFNAAIMKCDKDFFLVAHEIESKTVKDCVSFYFFWKKVCPDEYRRLRAVRKKRLEEQQFDSYNLRSCNASTSINQALTSDTSDEQALLMVIPCHNVHNHWSQDGNDESHSCHSGQMGSRDLSRNHVKFKPESKKKKSTGYICKKCGKTFAKLKSRNNHFSNCTGNERR